MEEQQQFIDEAAKKEAVSIHKTNEGTFIYIPNSIKGLQQKVCEYLNEVNPEQDAK